MQWGRSGLLGRRLGHAGGIGKGVHAALFGGGEGGVPGDERQVALQQLLRLLGLLLVGGVGGEVGEVCWFWAKVFQNDCSAKGSR